MKRVISIIIFSIYLTINLDATTPTYANVTKLYIATFNRAPDSKGLDYWVYKSHLTLEEIAESFFDQTETKALYPNSYSNRRFIQAIYENVLGREPDRAGERYWLNELNSGHIKRSLFILAIVNGALNDDSILLEKKTKVGLEFIKSKIDDIKIAKRIMKSVTIDSSVDEVFKKAGFIKTTSGIYIKEDNTTNNIDYSNHLKDTSNSSSIEHNKYTNNRYNSNNSQYTPSTKSTSESKYTTTTYNNHNKSHSLPSEDNSSKKEITNSINDTNNQNSILILDKINTDNKYYQLEDSNDSINDTDNGNYSPTLEDNSSKKETITKDRYMNDTIDDTSEKNSPKKKRIDNNSSITREAPLLENNSSKEETTNNEYEDRNSDDSNRTTISSLEDNLSKKVGWYMRTVVEADLANSKRYIQSKAGVFGEYIDSIDERDRHDIPSMGTAILRVVFTHPNWENEKSFFSDYRAYRSDIHREVWTFQVKNDRDVNLANATLKISLKGPYDIYQSQNGNFKERLSNSDNLKKNITLIDVDNGIDYLYGDSQYITLSMDGKHTRTFRWVIGDVKEEDYKPISNIKSRSLIFHKRVEGTFGYPPN